MYTVVMDICMVVMKYMVVIEIHYCHGIILSWKNIVVMNTVVIEICCCYRDILLSWMCILLSCTHGNVRIALWYVDGQCCHSDVQT